MILNRNSTLWYYSVFNLSEKSIQVDLCSVSVKSITLNKFVTVVAFGNEQWSSDATEGFGEFACNQNDD